MKVVLGSTNEEKIRTLRDALKELHLDAQISGIKVSSEITDQPLDKETTRAGAINRAKNARILDPTADFWFGLEGGLHDYGEGYHLATYACLIDKDNNRFIGKGEEIHLPVEVSEKVKNGEWFGKAIREYAQEHEIDQNLITRLSPFIQAIQNAYATYLKEKGHLFYRKGTIGIVVDDDKNFLIVQIIDYGENDWRFPGGGVDEDKAEKDAILRELSEELRSNKFEIVKTSQRKIKYDWPDFVIAKRLKKEGKTWRGQEQTQFLVKFTGSKDEIKPDPNELRQVKWVKYEDLVNHFNFPGQLEEAESVLKEFQII